MNTNQTQSAPLNNAQIAMNITNGALLVTGNVVVVSGIAYASDKLGLSNAASCTMLSVYGLVLMSNLNSIIKKFFN